MRADDVSDRNGLSALLAAVAEEFDSPVPLPEDRTVEAPAFPTEVLPARARGLVETVAASSQTPPDLAANLLLGVCSATVAGKARVNAVSHREHLNVWTAVILPPGERKSSVLAPLLAPFYGLQQERQDEAAAGLAEREATLELVKAEFERLKKAKDTTAARLAEALRARTEAEAALAAPALLVVDDVTPERLAIDLQANPRLLLAAAEGGAIDNFLGRYQRGVPNLDLLNKAWAGESHTVRRVSLGDTGLHLERPTLAIAIAPQPVVMRQAARNGVLTARGTLSRFLVAAPASLVGTRSSVAPPLDHEALAAYDALVRELVASDEIPEDIPILPPAHELIRSYRDGLERRAGAAVDDRLRAFLSRMSGYVYRLAGVLQALEHGAAAFNKPIGKNTAEGAVVLAGYYETHAQIALDLMGEDEVMRRARRAYQWLEEHLDGTGTPSVTKVRDLHRAHTYWSSQELAEALQVLEDRDLYRRARHHTGTKGRPGVYLVRNPHLARTADENARNRPAPALDVHPHHGGCVVRGCDRAGDIAHDGDLYCAQHAIEYRIQFDPLVDDIQTSRPCQNCGRAFITSADSATCLCPECLLPDPETEAL